MNLKELKYVIDSALDKCPGAAQWDIIVSRDGTMREELFEVDGVESCVYEPDPTLIGNYFRVRIAESEEKENALCFYVLPSSR